MRDTSSGAWSARKARAMGARVTGEGGGGCPGIVGAGVWRLSRVLRHRCRVTGARPVSVRDGGICVLVDSGRRPRGGIVAAPGWGGDSAVAHGRVDLGHLHCAGGYVAQET